MVVAFVNPVPLLFPEQAGGAQARQQAGLTALLRGAQLVPVTGLDETQLLELPVIFDSWQVLLHGAVVVNEQGDEDPGWRRLTVQAQREAEQALTLAGQAAHHIRALHQLDVDLEVVVRHGAPLLVRLTQPLDLAGPLTEAAEFCRAWLAEGPFSSVLRVVASRAEVAILPRAIAPEGAVSYVLHQWPEDVLSVGVSAEPGDAAYLARCDYALVPGDWPLPQDAELAEE